MSFRHRLRQGAQYSAMQDVHHTQEGHVCQYAMQDASMYFIGESVTMLKYNMQVCRTRCKYVGIYYVYVIHSTYPYHVWQAMTGICFSDLKV
jgi:hypothetical protein